LFKKRKSGFTKMTVIGNRRGDDAPMVKLELVEKPKEKEEKKEEKKAKTKEEKSSPKAAKKEK